MPQTKEGAAKARRKMIEDFGSEEAYRAHMAEIGGRGGLAKHPEKGFGSNKDLAKEVGRKGGLKSRPPKKAIDQPQSHSGGKRILESLKKNLGLAL